LGPVQKDHCGARRTRLRRVLRVHNFNEPLANPRLAEEIAHVRRTVPDAKPAVYTNGDLLKADRLAELLELGVAYVRVTRYPHRASVLPTFEALQRWLRQAGIAEAFPWEFNSVRQGLAAVGKHPDTGSASPACRTCVQALPETRR
jgi:hypothetical protein